MINIQHLIDGAKCLEVVRQLRWPNGVRCPDCGAALVNKRGDFMLTQPIVSDMNAKRAGTSSMT
jgi:hypothetical protein